MIPAIPSLRQSMAWIHGWLGLLAGWILFAMFLTGTASYFRPEITRWMQPEAMTPVVPAALSASAAVRHLQRVGADDAQWFVYLPGDRTGATRVFQIARPNPDPKAPPAKPREELLLDPATGRPVAARATRGGEHFYRFHFQLQLPYPWGRWLAGIAAMLMLTAIISGVVTHKRLFADFFTLRWNKGQRSWLDAHNASAVLALPYHAMIAYTGLVTLVAMYMPWPIAANYAKPAAFLGEAFGSPDAGEAAGIRAPLVPVAPLVRDAEARWGAAVTRMVVRNPNDAAGTITLYRTLGASIDSRTPSLTYSGTTGRLLAKGGAHGPAMATAGVMLGLHVAAFAGPALRWVLFLLGLTGAAMVGTGLVLWTAKRRRAGMTAFFGLRLVERLNVAAVAGLPVGMAAYLLANRLIPAAAEGRADREVAAMFWTWGLVGVVAALRPVRRAWTEGFALGAAAFAAIPLVNAGTTSRGLFASIARGDTLFIAFDLAFLICAALLAVGAWRAGRRPTARKRAARRAPEPAHA